MLQSKEDLMISIETFLKKFNRISFRETPKVLLLAWEKFFKIKHREKQHPLEDIQELIRKLLEDVQNISEELAEYINSPSMGDEAFDTISGNGKGRSCSLGELAHIDLIPPGINEDNLDPEGDIHLVERLLYDNSSPRPS
ncbi:hypothetical protein Tco_0117933 [Tanacetum coccineum]